MTFPSAVLPLESAVVGDLVFFDSADEISRLIRWAERLRWRGDKNHVAWLDHQEADGTWILGQAQGSGVTDTAPLVLGPKDVVVSLPTGANRDKVLYFLRQQVGVKYGFLTDFSIFLTILLPWFLRVMRSNTWICSAVVAEGLRFGGWYHPWGDIYQVAPDPLFTVLTGVS